MSVSPLLGSAKPQYFDTTTGDFLAAGYIEFYIGGTSNPLDTFVSVTGLVANENPVILNSRGEPDNQIHGTDGVLYKAVLKDSTGTVIWTQDSLYTVNSTGASDATDANAAAITALSDRIYLNSIDAKTLAYTILTSDEGKLIDCTSGTFTVSLLAAASVSEGFEVTIFNRGSGIVTIDGNSAETINGSATIDLSGDSWATVVSDGVSGWRAIQSEASSAGIVSGFTRSSIIYFSENAAVDDVFDIDANIGLTFETIGPPGTGADNSWSALNSLPTDSVAILIRINNQMIGQSIGTFSSTAWAEKGGASLPTGTINMVSKVDCFVETTPNGQAQDISEVWVPVNSVKHIEMAWGTSTTGAIHSEFVSMTLVAFAV